MKLNKIERIKKRLPPYAFRHTVTQIDLHTLDEADRFYLKNYGIYNIKLEPERFMIRLRISGGRIEARKLKEIAVVTQRHSATLLVTARAQLEIHALHAGNVLEVWQALNDTGLSSLQTLTDNFRGIVTDPYDGAASDARIEVYPLIHRMESLVLDRPEWMGMLPRKFNTAICGTATPDIHFFGNDLFFALASKEGEWGFNLYLGGKNSAMAQDADLFVMPRRVPELFLAVAEAYRHYGLRQTRSKTRLYHLLEEIGMVAFVERVGEFYPYTLEKSGKLEIRKVQRSNAVVLKSGSYSCCVQSRFGRIEAEKLLEIADYAEREDLEIRLGVDQNLHLLGLKTPVVPFAPIEGASEITACAGSSYCALSLWDIKEDTRYLPLDLIERCRIAVGFSGCLKGCGRHQHADIGLVGLRTNIYGATQKAARVYLGGQYSSGGAVARLVFPVVPVGELHRVLTVVIEAFLQSGAEDFEQFSREYLNPLSPDFLLLWFLSKLALDVAIPFQKVPEQILYGQLRQTDGFPEVEEEDGKYSRAIRILMHRLWDD